MTIGIVGAGNMGRSIAIQLAKTGERVTLSDRNLTAFQIELSQRYGLDYRLTFKLLPAELPM